MWPLVFLIQRLHDNPTNQNAEPFAFGQASHLQSIAAAKNWFWAAPDSLDLDRHSAWLQAQSQPCRIWCLLPRDGKTDVRTQAFQTGFEADTRHRGGVWVLPASSSWWQLGTDRQLGTERGSSDLKQRSPFPFLGTRIVATIPFVFKASQVLRQVVAVLWVSRQQVA